MKVPERCSRGLGFPRSKLTMVFEQQKSRTVSLGTDESHEEGTQLKLRDFRMVTKSLEFGPLLN